MDGTDHENAAARCPWLNEKRLSSPSYVHNVRGGVHSGTPSSQQRLIPPDGNKNADYVVKSELQLEKKILALRSVKSRQKASFTKARRQFTELIEAADIIQINENKLLIASNKVDEAQEKAMGTLQELVDIYSHLERYPDIDKTLAEMEKLEEDFANCQNALERYA